MVVHRAQPRVSPSLSVAYHRYRGLALPTPVISTAWRISTCSWCAAQDLEIFRPYADNVTAVVNCDADESVSWDFRHRASLAADVKACILDAHQHHGLADLHRRCACDRVGPSKFPTTAGVGLRA